MRMWGMVALFCPSALLARKTSHSTCPDLPARVRRSGSPSAGGGTIVPLTAPPHTPHRSPSHEVAALGTILVYLALIPPVWPS